MKSSWLLFSPDFFCFPLDLDSFELRLCASHKKITTQEVGNRERRYYSKGLISSTLYNSLHVHYKSWYISSAVLTSATHLAILYADRSEFDHQGKSRANSCRYFEKFCDKIAQPDWLTLVAIRWRMSANIFSDI